MWAGGHQAPYSAVHQGMGRASTKVGDVFPGFRGSDTLRLRVAFSAKIRADDSQYFLKHRHKLDTWHALI